MPETKKLKILIAGAGIAGLTTALSLIRRGFEVELYEQAPELREVGAGIQISSNGMLVFADLGVADRVLAVSASPERREIRQWRSGQTWSTFELGAASIATYGHPHIAIFRPDLLSALAEAVRESAPNAIRFARKVSGCSQDGDSVALHFEDGASAIGDALIGADGIHSVIRDALHGPDSPEFSGIISWRGVIPMESLPVHLRRHVVTIWVGPGSHVVHYPLRKGELMNFVGIVENDDWRIESWSSRGVREQLAAAFPGWHADVATMAKAIEQPFIGALMLRRPLSQWCFDRVTLVGDACHPTLPFLAQGAVMAIEDGQILARALDARGNNVKSAFQSYEAARRQRTARVMTSSADMVKSFHNPALGNTPAAQAYAELEFSQQRAKEQFDWIYRYDATRAPI